MTVDHNQDTKTQRREMRAIYTVVVVSREAVVL